MVQTVAITAFEVKCHVDNFYLKVNAVAKQLSAVNKSVLNVLEI